MCKPIALLDPQICGISLGDLKKDPTPSEIASLFMTLSDDDMAEFFHAVGLIGDAWDKEKHGDLYFGSTWQLGKAGEHVAECGPDAGARVIEALSEGLKRDKGT